MKKFKIMAIILMGLSFTANSFAGPFGLEMGMKIEEIDKNAKKLAENAYKVSVPKPHKSFSVYYVYTCPSKGLHTIKAISSPITTNGYGEDLKSNFESMEKKLKKVYGENKKFDFLRSESLWSESNYWMMGLLKKDRTLAAYWTEEYKSKLKDDFKSISLTAIAINQGAGLIVLEYEFLNTSSCRKENASKEDDSL